MGVRPCKAQRWPESRDARRGFSAFLLQENDERLKWRGAHYSAGLQIACRSSADSRVCCQSSPGQCCWSRLVYLYDLFCKGTLKLQKRIKVCFFISTTTVRFTSDCKEQLLRLKLVLSFWQSKICGGGYFSILRPV